MRGYILFSRSLTLRPRSRNPFGLEVESPLLMRQRLIVLPELQFGLPGGFSKAAEKFALRQIWARKAMSHSNTGPVGRVEASGFQGVVQPIALRVQSLTRGAPAAFGMRCPVLRSGQTQIKRQHAPITKSHPSLLICSTRSRLAFGTKSDARCYSSLPPSVPRSLCHSMSQLGLSFCSLSARASSQGETGKSSKAGSGHRRAWSSS